MIYSTNRIDYTEDVDMTPKSSTFISMNLDEVSLLFEDINNTIFETIIEADFNEALALKEEDQNSENKNTESNNNDSKDNNSSSDISTSNDNDSSSDKKEESKDKEEKKKSLWERIKGFFKKIIEKLKGLFTSLQDKFMHVIDMDKKLYDKYHELFTMDNMKDFEPIDDCLDLKKLLLIRKEYDDKLLQYSNEYNSIMNPNSSGNSSTKNNFDDFSNLLKEYNEKLKEVYENKIKWKPESDGEIKIIISAIVEESLKSIKESQEALKETVRQLENNIKSMDNEVKRIDLENFKELMDSKIKATKTLISCINISISSKKQAYKDARKKFITMLNWAKRHKNKKSEDNDNEKNENQEQSSTEESVYNNLLADRSDMYIESALEDYNDSAFQSAIYLAAEADSVYNNLFKSIGIAELKEFVEVDNLIIYEGAKFNSVKEAVINFFKGIIKRITKIYDNIADRLGSLVNKYYERVGRNLKDIKPNDINNLDNEKIVKYIGTIYKYDTSNFSKYVDKLEDTIFQSYDKVTNFIANEASKEEIDKYMNNMESSYIKNATGIEASNLKELGIKLKEKHEEKIDVTKSYLINNWNYITDVVKGGNMKKYLKKNKDKYINAFNEAIRETSKLKGEDTSSYTLKRFSTLLKNITLCMNTIMSVQIDLNYKEFRVNQMVAFKVAKMLGKK